MNATAVPRFRPGFRLQRDKARDAWVLLGPERLFVPDEHAVAVLQLMDGVRDVAAIAADLALRYQAPVAEIEADVWTMLNDLAVRGAVAL